MYISEFGKSEHCWICIRVCCGLFGDIDSGFQAAVVEIGGLRGEHELTLYEQWTLLSHSHPRVLVRLDYCPPRPRYVQCSVLSFCALKENNSFRKYPITINFTLFFRTRCDLWCVLVRTDNAP